MTIGEAETAFNAHLLADPDVVHDCSCFALGSLWIPNQVIPGTEHPPTECEVLIRRAGEVQTGVLRHSAIGKDILHVTKRALQIHPQSVVLLPL